MIVTNSLTGGGAERSMNLVCNELSQRGWPISLVPINSSPPDQVIPVCDVFSLERQWKGGFANTISAIRKFNQVVKSWNPDVIILNCDLPELFGVLLFSHRHLVAVEHINRPWLTRISLGRIVRKLLRFRKVIWVAVSSHLTIWPDMQVPKAILLNSISTSDLLPIENSNSISVSNLKRLVFIGRLAPQKRPDWLLEIGAQIRLPLEIIGEGSMRAAMQNDAAARNLSVNFHGQIRQPWAIIEEGDLLIVPSEYEGDGLVVIEGMQQGVPMLLADIPDFRRFDFPETNYCATQQDFIERIDDFGNRLHDLSIPSRTAAQILASRSLSEVGDTWEVFLNSF